MKKKAVGYIRVSTIHQIEGENLDTQRKQIKQFIQQKDWQLTKVYADEGRSGAKIEYRPEFQQMISDAKAGEFEVIVFYKLSRFARNAREYQNLAFELEQHGVQLASVKENIDPTTKTGKMIAGILSLFAEWEHETIREQMLENRTTKWKNGRTFIGKSPFGYVWNKEFKKLEINEQEAKFYKRIINMYVNQGMSYKDIVIKLNSEGLKVKSAKWSSAVISYLLSNPAYYGHYVVNKYYYEDGNRGPGTRRTNKEKPISEQIIFPIPPIISKSEWDKIAETREFRRVKTKRIGEFTHTFYLRDLLYCNRCGGRIKHHVGNRRKDGTRIRYYRCYWSGSQKRNTEVGRTKKCILPLINAKRLEAIVWLKLMLVFEIKPEEIINELYGLENYDKRLKELQQIVEQLEQELKSNNRTKNRLYQMLENPDLDMNDLQEQLQKNTENRLTIESNLKNSKSELKQLEDAREDREKTIEFVQDNRDQISFIRMELDKLDVDDRKILVEAMIDKKKIMVDHKDDLPGEPPIPFVICKRRFNPDILRRLADEGKISLFGKNRTGYFC